MKCLSSTHRSASRLPLLAIYHLHSPPQRPWSRREYGLSRMAQPPGPSGLCPNHVCEAVDCPSPDRGNNVKFCLTKFVNHLAAGLAPAFISPHLCGPTLLAINKKNGGLQLIAAGEVLCHLVSKCLAIPTRPAALSLLSQLELGVRAKGGCKVIIHASSHLMSTTSTHHPWSLLLDFSNAFNNICLPLSRVIVYSCCN